MDRRTLTVCICAAIALVIIDAVAVFFLYRPMFGRVHASDAAQVAETPAPVPEETSAPAAVAEPTDTTVAAAAVAVKVPEGPWQVKNCSTGLMNTLSQRDDWSLSLADENGAVQWELPFSGPLCGYVGTVDFYANNKLQFLMISGNRLCLVDRLGRMVGGFPVQLSKEVLLGPGIYDFNGQRKYNIIVLNTDNTIDLYNLKGEKPAKWKTIAPSSTVLALPDYFEVGAHSCWAVRTASGNEVYSFYGDFVKSFSGEIDKSELY